MRTLSMIVLLLLTLAACSHSISLQFPSQTLTVETFSQGKPVQRCSIAAGSDKFRKLNELMQENVKGWHSRSADYVPAIVVISSDVNLYFDGGLLVVNYSGGEYSRTVSPDSL